MILRSWTSRIAGLFRRRRFEDEMTREFRAHLEMAIEDYLSQGMSPQQARLEAIRAFGRPEIIKDELRDTSRVPALDSVRRDLRLAVRSLLRNPAFFLLSGAMLALGIGSVTTVSAFFDAIVLQPLPFPRASELVMLWTTIPGQKIEEDGSSYLNISDWKRLNRSFQDLALVSRAETATLLDPPEPRQVRVARVSSNLFDLLGAKPLLGRTFTQAEEDHRDHLAVISYSFWHSRFGGSPHVIGKTIPAENGVSAIIGVMPPEFRFPSKDTEFWEPHTVMPYWPRVSHQRGSDLYKVVGRLKPGVTPAEAQVDMSELSQRLAVVEPGMPRGLGVKIVPLVEQLTGRYLPLALRLLFAAVGGILLIACANVAGMLLIRGGAREREFAIRTAIGAGRGRLIQSLLLEGLVLALAGGAVGVAAGSVAIRLIEGSLPLELPHLGPVELKIPVVAFSLILSVLTVLGCGLFPALRLTVVPPGIALKGSGGSVSSRGRLRGVFVVGELAVATVLVAGTILLVRSFLNVQAVQPGFETERVVAIRVTLPSSYDAVRSGRYFAEALQRLQSLPGVVSAGAIHELFFEYNPDTVITVEGKAPPQPGEPTPQLIGDAVFGDCFRTLGVPLLRGRHLSDRDRADAPTVTVINEAMAEAFFPAEDPIGRRFTFGTPAPGEKTNWITVVGVVGNMHRQGLETAAIPQMFGWRDQFPNNRMDIVVRTSLPPGAIGPSIREELRRTGAGAVLGPVTTVRDQLLKFEAWRKFQTWLLMAMAAIALVLASMGTYGLLQQYVTQRKREIGIRMALGAGAGEVQGIILRQAMSFVAAGLLLGMGLAAAAGHAMRSLLFGVSEQDPATAGLAVLALFAAAAAAAYFPARRASRIEPAITLRQD